MNKKQAHGIIILFDIVCLLGFWYFSNEINRVFLGISNHSDMVKFNSKMGFFIFALGMPIIHLVIIIEHLRVEFIHRHVQFINYGIFTMIILLFVSAFTISSIIKAKVEYAGYVNCEALEWSGTYSKSYTYTRNQAICRQLTEKEEARKRKAAFIPPG